MNITKSLLKATICFTLSFVFCVEIMAQRDLKKKDQTNTQSTTETQIEKQPSNSNDRKKIIVVLDFDNVSPQCRDNIYGQNVATQLSTAFSRTGEYTVIEKQRIEDIFKEIKISQEERYKNETAAKVGEALSANTVVLGTITQCSADIKTTGVIIGRTLHYSIKVSLAIRLVNISSAEVQDAISISESATETSGCIKGFCSETAITYDLQIKLFNKAVEKGVKKAVTQLSSIIEGKSNAIATTKLPENSDETTQPGPPNPSPPGKPETTSPPRIRTISFPKVAEIDRTTVYITGLGKNVHIGDLLSIMRGKEIKDPDTGEVVDFDGKEIAKVEVIEVRENTVKAKIIKGTGIRVRDYVQPVQ